MLLRNLANRESPTDERSCYYFKTRNFENLLTKNYHLIYVYRKALSTKKASSCQVISAQGLETFAKSGLFAIKTIKMTQLGHFVLARIEV